MAQIFKLKKPLFLPIGNEADQRGYTFFPPTQFGLGYSGFRPDAEKKTLNVDLTVRRVDDAAQVFILKSFSVTAEGFETSEVLNQKEIDAAKQRGDELAQSILDLEASLRDLGDAEANLFSAMATTEKDGELEKLRKQLDGVQAGIKESRQQLDSVRKEKSELKVPDAVFARTFDYATVIEWFDKEGQLLKEAIPYALEIKFMGRRVGDFIETE